MDIIVDIDGTLADITHRLHFIAKPKPRWPEFFDACEEDTPILPVVNMVISLWTAGNRIVFCSGRPERCRAKTARWLQRHLIVTPANPLLYMRKDGDFRADDIVKRELLQTMRAATFNPVLAIDDRKRVVDMWRAEGLICAQVAEGEF